MTPPTPPAGARLTDEQIVKAWEAYDRRYPEDPALSALTHAVMARIARYNLTTEVQCPSLLAFGPIYSALEMVQAHRAAAIPGRDAIRRTASPPSAGFSDRAAARVSGADESTEIDRLLSAAPLVCFPTRMEKLRHAVACVYRLAERAYEPRTERVSGGEAVERSAENHAFGEPAAQEVARQALVALYEHNTALYVLAAEQPQTSPLRRQFSEIVADIDKAADALSRVAPPAPSVEAWKRAAEMPGWRLLPNEPWMERSGSGEYLKRADVLAALQRSREGAQS